MKIWQEKEYKNEFDTMMAKMTTIVKESNYSIVQYLNKTKERMQDVEAELQYETVFCVIQLVWKTSSSGPV